MKVVPIVKPDLDMFMFECVGCGHSHAYITRTSTEYNERHKKEFGGDVPCWWFNGDLEKPSFQPSLMNRVRKKAEDGEKAQDYVCHLYVTDGFIQYLPDCTHGYAGKTVPMEET